MVYFNINKNGKNYEIRLDARVENRKGEWEAMQQAELEELIRDKAIDAFCNELEN